MNNKSLKETAAEILEKTLKRGIKDVKVQAIDQHKTMVLYRQGKIDKLEETTTRNISLEIFDKGKYGTCTLNDFSPEAIDSFLDNSVVMTRAMETDPYREITDPKFYGNRENHDLELHSKELADLSIDSIKSTAQAIEACVKSEAGDIAASTEGFMEAGEYYTYRIYSNGFEGEKKDTQAWIGGRANLKDKDGKRPSDGSEAGSRFLKDLKSPDEIGREIVERAKMKLGATKQNTCRTVMILENRVVARLLYSLIQAMSGRSIQQNNSFFSLNDNGKTIGSQLLTLKDDPFIKKAWGSRLFDMDGISARPFTLIDQGKLENFYINYYYSKKLKTKPTTGWPSNLLIEPGQASLENMIKNTEDGIIVGNFLGGNCNATTGDFSYGISGTKIEKGKPTIAVTEMNISGNHKEFWQKLVALGNDIWPHSTLRSPSLKFSDVQFSGK